MTNLEIAKKYLEIVEQEYKDGIIDESNYKQQLQAVALYTDLGEVLNDPANASYHQWRNQMKQAFYDRPEYFEEGMDETHEEEQEVRTLKHGEDF